MSKTNFFEANRELVVYVGLSLLVLAVYWQTTGFAFINLDDNLYVYDNPVVSSGINRQSIEWSLTAFHAANWHPLTWLSLALDVELFGPGPGGHHAVNVLLHLLNSILAFVVFRRLTGAFWRPAILAALFAAHPAHVESVAWVAERKDVLSTLFWLLTMWAYAAYVKKEKEKRRKGEKEKRRKGEKENERREEAERSASSPVSFSPFLLFSSSFLLVLLLFTLGLLAKPMLVTLPFVLLLCDFWPLGRLKRLGDLPALVAEKIPLFALSAASSYITILAQRSVGAVESLEYLPVATRVVNSLVSYAKYVAMLFYPRDLAVWYPYENVFPLWHLAAAVVLLAGVSALALRERRRRPYLLWGWLFYLGTLVPVIGLVQVGSQSMADRYTYVPYFGLFVMLVWGAHDLLHDKKRIFFAAFAVATLACAALAYRQTTFWRNSETLYRRALAVTEGNHLAGHNLCHALLLADRLDEAETYCRAAIAWKRNYTEVYNTLAVIQIRRGQYAGAEQTLRETLGFAPSYNLTYINLALALALQERPEEAEENLRQAVVLSGNTIAPRTWINALNALVATYEKQGKFDKAEENLRRVLNLAPEDAGARAHLALTLLNLKRYDEADAEIDEAIRRQSDQPRFHRTKGLIALAQNKREAAVASLTKALQLDPNDAEARENLKKAKGEP